MVLHAFLLRIFHFQNKPFCHNDDPTNVYVCDNSTERERVSAYNTTYTQTENLLSAHSTHAEQSKTNKTWMKNNSNKHKLYFMRKHEHFHSSVVVALRWNGCMLCPQWVVESPKNTTNKKRSQLWVKNEKSSRKIVFIQSICYSATSKISWSQFVASSWIYKYRKVQSEVCTKRVNRQMKNEWERK